jgi:Leucine-rich repeat (LRR) protein
LSDYPDIEDLSLRSCDVSDLSALQGLSRLRRLSVAFGPLSSLDLKFCGGVLEFLGLSRLRRLKDLSTLPLMPKLEHLVVTHIHSYTLIFDFQLFPNLRQLSIWNTDWRSPSWLSHLPGLETLHISQIIVEDKDWKPILSLARLRHLHGMQSVFGSVARKEFVRLRPEVRIDQEFV